MSRLLGWMPASADRLNPILVKEFRQAVRSRLVIAVLILFLIVNVAILGGYLLLTPDVQTSSTGGRGIFMGLLSLLLFTCLLFVPLHAGVRLALERNDANIDLLFITTVTPGAIIRGKYWTAMALTLLIFSACTPFLVFTYLLRGIDLPTIFFLLAVGFLICAAANALGILAGCIPGSWFMRGLVGLGLAFILFVTVVATLEWITFAFMFGISRPAWGREFWGIFGTIAFMELLGIGLLQVQSVALISPKAANRMLLPRIYITGCWALSGLVTAVWNWIHATCDTVDVWMICSGIAFGCLAVLAMGERDAWSARVRRKIPQNRVLRLIAFLLYTGSAGGMAWCALMFVATLLAGIAFVGFLSVELGISVGPDFEETCTNLSLSFGYVLCYCLTTAFLRATVLRKIPTLYLPFVAVFLGLALALGPYLVAFFATDPRFWRAESTWYLVGSPLILSAESGRLSRAPIGSFVTTWLAISLLGSVPWFIGQWRRFVPYRAAVVEETQTVNVTTDPASVGRCLATTNGAQEHT